MPPQSIIAGGTVYFVVTASSVDDVIAEVSEEDVISAIVGISSVEQCGSAPRCIGEDDLLDFMGFIDKNVEKCDPFGAVGERDHQAATVWGKVDSCNRSRQSCTEHNAIVAPAQFIGGRPLIADNSIIDDVGAIACMDIIFVITKAAPQMVVAAAAGNLVRAFASENFIIARIAYERIAFRIAAVDKVILVRRKASKYQVLELLPRQRRAIGETDLVEHPFTARNELLTDINGTCMAGYRDTDAVIHIGAVRIGQYV